ncbi:hypothetical protein VARIO8X_120353 [Burkholderiales bacterium 8X]|nr:hypothetical protein VARIO8X_120353 [Burkholderiales bacterium 8X]
MAAFVNPRDHRHASCFLIRCLARGAERFIVAASASCAAAGGAGGRGLDGRHVGDCATRSFARLDGAERHRGCAQALRRIDHQRPAGLGLPGPSQGQAAAERLHHPR